SLGNKHLMNILPAYLSVVKNGGMLICDEFSSGLHNDLEELLIKYFMKYARQAQIFIVSHSTNLLTSRLFRPDQLYAVNFDKEGSNVVKFSSEQPRTGQNYEKMYLGGVFSGLPRYNEI
ncbi:MAG: ATP-binding protein, partial [Ruminococcaceae bacterium]|nr:ATP-binding protein [Oscillospiraceae bacterium]